MTLSLDAFSYFTKSTLLKLALDYPLNPPVEAILLWDVVLLLLLLLSIVLIEIALLLLLQPKSLILIYYPSCIFLLVVYPPLLILCNKFVEPDVLVKPSLLAVYSETN